MRVGIALPNSVPHVRAEIIPRWAAEAEAAGFSVLGTVGRIAFPGVLDAVTRTQFRNAVSAWFRAGDHRSPDPPAYAWLAGITAPTVVVAGDLEYPMVTDSANQIASRIPAATRASSPAWTTCCHYALPPDSRR
jgi:hypothetical protein